MRFVVYALILALCAQAAAAQESRFPPGDRVRYRLEGERHWQLGFFQSISAHGLVFVANETAPLDTLPLSALDVVELHRGNHVSGSKVLFFTTIGFFAGGLIGVAAGCSGGVCDGEAAIGAYGALAAGAAVGVGASLVVGLIPVTRWERVHGDAEQPRSGPWSSRGLVVKYRF